MSQTLYKGYVYLTKSFDFGGRVEDAPLSTHVSTDREATIAYLEALYEQGFIKAYRLLYSPSGDLDMWYNDDEVVYLKD